MSAGSSSPSSFSSSSPPSTSPSPSILIQDEKELLGNREMALAFNTDSNSDADHDNDHVPLVRGVSDLWRSVNHVAIVVSDVGTSLQFYTDVVGMKQMLRPNFDR